MKKVLASILVLGAFLPVLGQAAETEQQKFDKVIYQAYADGMNERFNVMVNLSKTCKDEADFMIQFFHLDRNSEAVKSLTAKLVGVKMPQITMVKDGVEYSAGGTKTVVTLTPKLGVVSMNGQEMALQNDVKMNGLFARLQLLERPAMAGVIGTLVDFAKSPFKSITSDPVLYAGELVGDVAHITGASAALGCVLGVNNGGEGSALSQCKNGAIDGAKVGVEVGLFALELKQLGLVAGVAGIELGNVKLFANMKLESEAIKSITLGQAVGTLGVSAFMLWAFEPQMFAHGGKLECIGDKGYFKFSAIGGKQEAFSVTDFGRSDYSNFKPPVSKDEVASRIRGYDKLSPETQKVVLDGVMADLEAKQTICKKHGSGYTKKFLIESGTGPALQKIQGTSQ